MFLIFSEDLAVILRKFLAKLVMAIDVPVPDFIEER